AEEAGKTAPAAVEKMKSLRFIRNNSLFGLWDTIQSAKVDEHDGIQYPHPLSDRATRVRSRAAKSLPAAAAAPFHLLRHRLRGPGECRHRQADDDPRPGGVRQGGDWPWRGFVLHRLFPVGN